MEHIDEFLDEEPEDEDDLASMEDDVCDDDVDPEVLRDITNTTRLSLMINGNNKSVLPPATSPNEAKNELIDMLNETLPVINEHNRQMKESGLDRVLNTFDAKKIEEKVGGWLRRHNSLCAEPEDSFIPMPNPPNKHLKNSHAMEHFYRTPTVCRPPHINYHQEDSSDSDDSFNSGETARYIRSSRNGAIKNSASTTMMIKTYRMFKSTRQALRDKYACDQDEVADSHLNELRLRQRLAKESALRHYQQKHMSARSYKTMYPQYITPLSHPTHSRRRKIYRKRTVSNSNSTMDDDTSSESDSCYYGEIGRHSHRKQHQACCSQRHCVAYNAPPVLTSAVKRSQYSAMKKVPNLIHNDCTYYYLKTHKPPSPPSPNALPRKGMKKALKRLDNRPYRRESECRCCDDNRLCKKYK